MIKVGIVGMGSSADTSPRPSPKAYPASRWRGRRAGPGQSARSPGARPRVADTRGRRSSSTPSLRTDFMLSALPVTSRATRSGACPTPTRAPAPVP